MLMEKIINLINAIKPSVDSGYFLEIDFKPFIKLLVKDAVFSVDSDFRMFVQVESVKMEVSVPENFIPIDEGKAFISPELKEFMDSKNR